MSNNFEKIPQEMHQYPQWIVWRYEERQGKKPTKIPYNPNTGKKASVTNKDDWCSFDEAVLAATQSNSIYSGIGFVLTDNDPYAFIDFDDTKGDEKQLNKQLEIYRDFNSYSECSPSGKGLHIIVKGQIPKGCRSGFVEIYSNNRYMTMTGNVYNDRPIENRQELLHKLCEEMGGIPPKKIEQYIDGDEKYRDEEIIERGVNAKNGKKFKELLEGRWQSLYQSQSESDFAFVHMVAFYTQNKAQIARIFRKSELGRREKAKRNDYVDRMILRALEHKLPPIDLSGLKEFEEKTVNSPIPQNINCDTKSMNSFIPEFHNFWQPTEILPPLGLLGDMARFIYDASPRPVREISICAAIGMLAGIVGRAYNVSGTGLNTYVLLLAPTGTGKEAMASGINKLFGSIKNTVPASADFRGPAEIASGQALLRALSNPKKCCFVSIVGEFGLKIQQLSSVRANSSELMLKRVLLDLYNKSGQKDILAASIYAQKENNTDEIKSPAVTLLGESTPETFYAALDERLITDGLLPRFTIIEYKGKRPPRNKNHDMVEPSFALVQKLAEVTEYCLMMMQAQRVINVGLTREAMNFLDKVDVMVDAVINETNRDILRHLWNRAHLKTIKIAALVAVGKNFTAPEIDLEMAQWAYNLVSIDVLGIATKFEQGAIGRDDFESKQHDDIRKAIANYISKNYNEIKGYGVEEKMHIDRAIPYIYFSKYLLKRASFKNAKISGTTALKQAICNFVSTGELQEIEKNELKEKYNTTGRVFRIK